MYLCSSKLLQSMKCYIKGAGTEINLSEHIAHLQIFHVRNMEGHVYISDTKMKCLVAVYECIAANISQMK